jgi:5-methylcytosine-specific restriction protein A
LYFQLEPGQIHGRNELIVDLSDLLNTLPIHPPELRNHKFRNANGVGLKLSNFLAIDPGYEGRGMARFGKLDQQIFLEFQNDRDRLRRIAERIRRTMENEDVVHRLYLMDEEDDRLPLWEVKEGKVLYKLHKYRERNQAIVKEKKAQFLKDHKALFCEACAFDFERQYGTVGKGYIECHHRIPLAENELATTTNLSDLALVCANCHRMLHRDISHLSIDGLRALLRQKRHSG